MVCPAPPPAYGFRSPWGGAIFFPNVLCPYNQGLAKINATVIPNP